MSAFTGPQQVVLLQFASFALSRLTELHDALSRASARSAALEALLVTKGVVTAEELARGAPATPENPSVTEARDAAVHAVVRRILAGRGGAGSRTPIPPPLTCPGDRLYTLEHVWVRIVTAEPEHVGRFRVPGGRRARLGITPEIGAPASGPLSLELPRVGARVGRGDAVATLRSSASTTVVPAPMAGEVVAVNEELADRTETLRDDPYEGGWLVELAPHQEPGTGELLSAEAYQAFLASRR